MISLPGSETAPGYDDPLGLLRACHQRMRQNCQLLVTLTQAQIDAGTTAEVLRATTKVRRYFNQAAPHHHADEEQDLFPLLHDDPRLRASIDALRAEHASLEAAWAEIDDRLQQLNDQNSHPIRLDQVQAFQADYLRHIDMEESQVLPAADRLLNSGHLARLGERMAGRRGVEFKGTDDT